MKKLLLLALLPLALVGCSELEPTKKDFGWKEVKEKEKIVVLYGSGTDYKTYYNSEGGTLKYNLIAYDKITELYVLQKEPYSQTEINDYYIGTNITIYVYEV